MPNRQFIISAILVLIIGVNLFIIALNNILDYNSNWEFVKHVLLMDTTFPDNKLQWRSIHSESIQTIFYFFIIASEITASILCLAGAFKIYKSQEFGLANYGLTLSILIWLGAFITIGGEWFLMWQSSSWNGTDAALRYFLTSSVVLIYITLIEFQQRKTNTK